MKVVPFTSQGEFGKIFLVTKDLKNYFIIKKISNTLHFSKEAFILNKLSHINIIKFYGITYTKNGFLLKLEYFPSLSLQDYIHYSEKFTADKIYKIFIQLVKAIMYLHSIDIINTTKNGSVNYLPPEIVVNDRYDLKKVDVFCLGVVLFTLCTGSAPERDKELRVVEMHLQDNEFEELLLKMLFSDPDKRWDINQIHEYLFSHKEKSK
ncbi:serine threonine-protein kinase [Vairimorpha necatrix]|uniref:Serine threonine-protein kinase n=1 Tax=Vairimorpha necatrix TaxID=6039 RepID=A0AAX4JFR5_9MICR